MRPQEKSLLMIGGSGHARVLIDCIVASEKNLIGVLDPNLEKGSHVSGIRVLGGDQVLDDISRDTVELVNGLGVLPGKRSRWDVARTLGAKGYGFAVVVHPAAVVAGDVSLEPGAQIMAGCVLQSGVEVGYQSVVNTCGSIDHDTKIERNCWLSPGVTLCADVHVKAGAYIGAGVTIIQDISVGKGALVTAGSSITLDVPPSE